MARRQVMFFAQGVTADAGLFATFPDGASVEGRLDVLARAEFERVGNGGSGYENGPMRSHIVLVPGADWKF